MAGLRIPGQTSRISDHWAQHVARGSLGGADFTDSYGTPVYAVEDCVVTIVDNDPSGSGGRYLRMTFANGTHYEALHMSSIIAVRGGTYSRGTILGYSGASAYGSNYGTGGPHIHAHGIRQNGVRYDIEPYTDLDGSGSSSTPAGSSSGSAIIQEDDMPDAATTERIVRDQVDSLLRDKWVPEIMNQIRSVINTSTSHTQALRVSEGKNAGMIGLFDYQTGVVKVASNPDELQLWKDLGYLPNNETPQNVTQWAWDYALNLCNSMRATFAAQIAEAVKAAK